MKSLPDGYEEVVAAPFRDVGLWFVPTGKNVDLPPQFRLPVTPADYWKLAGGRDQGEAAGAVTGAQLTEGSPEPLVPVRGIIRVVYKGRMGNCMFMYSAARALHELLGFELQVDSESLKHLSMFDGPSSLPAQTRPRGWQPSEPGTDVTVVRHEVFDVFAIAADRRARTIALDGYVHQAGTLRHFLAACRAWFRLRDGSTGFGEGPCPGAGCGIGPGDVVMHLRAGDLSGKTAEETRMGKGSGLAVLPAWWFEAVLRAELQPPWNRSHAGRVIVVTEPGGEGEEAAKRLRSEWGAVVVSRTPEKDFAALVSADRFVGSCSTFSWWAAALRRKTEVHMPAFGVCDPRWPHQNSGKELVDYRASITGWHWHDVFELDSRPEGFVRGYG